MSDAVTFRSDLFEAIDDVLSAYHDWARSQLDWIDAELYRALDALLENWAEGPAPPGCEALCRILGALGPRWERWKQYADESGYVTRPIDDVAPDWWEKVFALEDEFLALSANPPKVLESVATFHAQKVENWQIAAIYGWYDGRGTPDVKKVEEELAQPGTHVGPDFVPPLERKRRQEEDRRRTAADEARRLVVERTGGRQARQAASETLEELLAQGVSIDQICRMKRMTEAEVLAACENNGWPAPKPAENLVAARGQYDRATGTAAGAVFEAQSAAAGQWEPQEDPTAESGEAQADSPEGTPQEETLERKIVRLYMEDGVDDLDKLAKQVSKKGRRVTRAKVEAVLKRYEDEPQAFGV